MLFNQLNNPLWSKCTCLDLSIYGMNPVLMLLDTEAYSGLLPPPLVTLLMLMDAAADGEDGEADAHTRKSNTPTWRVEEKKSTRSTPSSSTSNMQP